MKSIVQKRKMGELKIVSHGAEFPQMHEASVELDLEQLNHDRRGNLNQPKILLELQVVARDEQQLDKDELGKQLPPKCEGGVGHQQSLSRVDGRDFHRKLLSSWRYQNWTRVQFSLVLHHHTYNFAKRLFHGLNVGHEGMRWTI